MLIFDNPEIDVFWRQACEATGTDPATPHHAGTFAGPEDIAETAFIDEMNSRLAGLVAAGQKRGTTHMRLEFEHRSIPVREAGHCWIVTGAGGNPSCVVRITSVAIVPYEDVGLEFAASEGEGDLSLEYWHSEHRSYFRNQCAKWGYDWREDTPVVCESFEVVYRP
jgi:uncharacterized protein YhfF